MIDFPFWSTSKPEFTEDCVLVTASKIRGQYEYSVWIIKMVDFGDGQYMAWLTGDGEEYGDLKDLSADQYLVLQKPQ
jgi:hypothetical protein